MSSAAIRNAARAVKKKSTAANRAALKKEVQRLTAAKLVTATLNDAKRKAAKTKAAKPKKKVVAKNAVKDLVLKPAAKKKGTEAVKSSKKSPKRNGGSSKNGAKSKPAPKKKKASKVPPSENLSLLMTPPESLPANRSKYAVPVETDLPEQPESNFPGRIISVTEGPIDPSRYVIVDDRQRIELPSLTERIFPDGKAKPDPEACITPPIPETVSEPDANGGASGVFGLPTGDEPEAQEVAPALVPATELFGQKEDPGKIRCMNEDATTFEPRENVAALNGEDLARLRRVLEGTTYNVYQTADQLFGIKSADEEDAIFNRLQYGVELCRCDLCSVWKDKSEGKIDKENNFVCAECEKTAFGESDESANEE